MWLFNFFIGIIIIIALLVITWVLTVAFLAWYDTTDFDLYNIFTKFFQKRKKRKQKF